MKIGPLSGRRRAAAARQTRVLQFPLGQVTGASALAVAVRHVLDVPRGVYHLDVPLAEDCFLLVTSSGEKIIQWIARDASGRLPVDVDSGLQSMLDAIDPEWGEDVGGRPRRHLRLVRGGRPDDEQL